MGLYKQLANSECSINVIHYCESGVSQTRLEVFNGPPKAHGIKGPAGLQSTLPPWELSTSIQEPIPRRQVLRFAE